MDIKTLRSKSKDALLQELEQTRTHLKELEFKTAANQLKQVREIRQTKTTIARILTLLNSV